MNELRCWLIWAWKLTRFLAYRAGLFPAPVLNDRFGELMTVLGQAGGWRNRLRIRFPERCPQSGPAIFVGNHLRTDDPEVVFHAIFEATKHNIVIKYMMRHDFGDGLPFAKLLDINDMFVRMGAYMIDRNHVTLAQLKPFVTLLREGGSFGMFPGGTRSRSGQFFEYRDHITEPGGVSFFLAQAQRAKPDPPIPVVPVVRTWNPANRRTTLIFGAPRYLAATADRAAQKQFDLDLAYHMGDLVELNAAQLTAAILYLRCLHGQDGAVSIDDLVDRVRRVLAHVPGRPVEVDTVGNLADEVHTALAHFESCGLLRRHDGAVELATAEVLADLPQDKYYVRRNPIKYLVNQILHLWDVTQAIEAQAL